MPVFAVIATKGHQTIAAKISVAVGDNVYVLKTDTWLVDYNGTTVELADALGIRDGSSGSGLVIPVTNYNGRGPTDMWEWLKLHRATE